MKRTIDGKREQESGLYCVKCAEVSFGYARKVFADVGEQCIGCQSVVIEADEIRHDRVHPDLKWRAPTNLERMRKAVGK